MEPEQVVTGTEAPETETKVETKYAQYVSEPDPPEPAPDPTAELTSTVQALRDQVAAMQQQMTKSTMTPEEKKDFLSLLREGKIDEAENYMADKAAQRSASVLEERLRQHEKESRARLEYERRVDEFVNRVKSENQDLIPLEGMITANAQQRLERVLQTGKIRSQEELLTAYKEAVLKEVEAAKRLVQHYRGAGKTEAMTTREEVLSSSGVRPSAITTHGDRAAPVEQKPMTASDYIRERQARLAAQRGMA